MRSLIMLEVEHGEDTDVLEAFIHHILYAIREGDGEGAGRLNSWTVRVDLPECFVLDSGDKEETFDYRATHVSVRDGSPAMALGYDEDDSLLMLINEDGYRWSDPTEQWRPI